MKKLENKPFQLIGFNLNDKTPQALKEIMMKEKLGWRSFGNREALGGKWQISGTPTFYVIDPDGVIRYKWVGSPGAKAIDAAIEKLIQELESGAPSRAK